TFVSVWHWRSARNWRMIARAALIMWEFSELVGGGPRHWSPHCAGTRPVGGQACPGVLFFDTAQGLFLHGGLSIMDAMPQHSSRRDLLTRAVSLSGASLLRSTVAHAQPRSPNIV